MVLISRTGLQESERRPIKRHHFPSNRLSENETSLTHVMPPIAAPAPLASRPLAGLPNPFGRTGGACSILCNHPAPPSAVLGLLQAAKGEGNHLGSDVPDGEEEDEEEEAIVPEELFRRYTGTDSRPLTPALSSASDTLLGNRSEPLDSLFCVSSPPSLSATTTSTRKRYGPGSLSRRSQTPDPHYRSQAPQRQRTMLILDLRRSLSQDGGLFRQQSKGAQSTSPVSSAESPKNGPIVAKSQKAAAQINKKPPQQLGSNGQRQNDEGTAPKPISNNQALGGKKKVLPKRMERKYKVGADGESTGIGGTGQEGQVGTKVMPPTPREEEGNGRPSPPLERKGARKRPHKKKKKSIGGLEAGTLTSGRGETPEKEFRGMPEPRETQVSTLAGGGEATSSMSIRGLSRSTPEDALYASESRDGKLSTLPHTRPSTSQTRASPAIPYTLEAMGYNDVEDWDEENSFLDPQVLRHLERELDRESVECEFHPLRRRALGEALRTKWLKLHHLSRKKEKLVSMGNVHQTYGLDTRSWCQEPTNLWFTLPRTFSRQSARFDLPLDSRKFNVMTPLQYLQNHVVISTGRCLLYNRVFNCHRERDKQDEEPDDDEICYPEQRSMSSDHLVGALSDVMGRDLNKTQADYFLNLLHSEKLDSQASSCSNVPVKHPEKTSINFRTFSGIAALCERLIGGGADLFKNAEEQSSANNLGLLQPRPHDPPHEIEIVDFESLPNRLRSISHVNSQLSEMLMLIKEL